MKKFNSTLALVGIVSLTAVSSAYASKGGESGGGGDKCQDRIETIRNDISDWIQLGGSTYLDFSKARTTLNSYNSKMLKEIGLTKQNNQSSISCTPNAEDVKVDGVEKTCRADYSNPSSPTILCYSEEKDGHFVGGFMALSEEDQYFQIHHELAVLSKIEDQAGTNSNYPLSDQMGAHLQENIVKKLAVKPPCDPKSAKCSDLTPEYNRIMADSYTCSVDLTYNGKMYSASSNNVTAVGGLVELTVERVGTGSGYIQIYFDIDKPSISAGSLPGLENLITIQTTVQQLLNVSGADTMGVTNQIHRIDASNDQFSVIMGLKSQTGSTGSVTINCTENIAQ